MKKFSFYSLIAALVIILGLFLRLKFYLRGDALNLDEILLCLNFLNTDFFSVFLTPHNHQVCSPLFMALYWFIYKIAGGNEYILRLPPLLFGCASVIFFYFLLKKVFNSKLAIILGLFLFSILPPLIMYSKEIKEYSSDMLITILLLLFYEKINISSKKHIICYSLGIIALSLFSYTSIPIISLILLIKIAQSASFKEKLNYLYPFLSVSLSALYILIRSLPTREFMYQFWGAKFLPVWDEIKNFFQYCCFEPKFLNFMLCIFAVGVGIALFKRKKNILLLLILLFTVIASQARIYPIAERISLYLIPVFIIFLMYPLENTENRRINIIKNSIVVLMLFCFINIPAMFRNVLFSNFDFMDSHEERAIKKNGSEFLLKRFTPDAKLYCSYFAYQYIKYYDLVSGYNVIKNDTYIYDWHLNDDTVKNCWLIGFIDNPDKVKKTMSEDYNGGVYSINSRNMFKHNAEQILYYADMKKMKYETFLIDGGNEVDFISVIHIFQKQ